MAAAPFAAAAHTALAEMHTAALERTALEAVLEHTALEAVLEHTALEAVLEHTALEAVLEHTAPDMAPSASPAPLSVAAGPRATPSLGGTLGSRRNTENSTRDIDLHSRCPGSRDGDGSRLAGIFPSNTSTPCRPRCSRE